MFLDSWSLVSRKDGWLYLAWLGLARVMGDQIAWRLAIWRTVPFWACFIRVKWVEVWFNEK